MKRRDFLKYIAALPFASFFYPLPFTGKEKKTLFVDTVVAGFQYYRGEKIWRNLEVNDILHIAREPENPYDEQAIEVYWNREKLGYIPRVDNSLLAQLMDRGVKVYARIVSLNESNDPWERIGIRVEMEV